jgi:hypothetical protein
MTTMHHTRYKDGVLLQVLDTKDDSVNYIDRDTQTVLFRVDSNGLLTDANNAPIGQFVIRDSSWVLRLNDVEFKRGPENGLFKLPEFELECILEILNQE